MAFCADGTSVSALLERGRALIAAGRFEDALQPYRRAAEAEPGEAMAHAGIGAVLKALGRMDDARAAFERAVALAPRNGWLQRDLAECKRFAAGDPQIAAMEELAAAAGEWDQIPLHFALGKAFAELGRYEEAFRRFSLGNALVARRKPYGERTVQWLFRRIAQLFTRDFLRARDGAGDPSDVPIFIIGMPRSGTTLVEQILASHPSVHGAGEVPHLLLEASAIGGSEPFTEKIGLLTDAEWRALAQRYLVRLRAAAPLLPRITDKMPSNFFFVGLIHVALPNARIIHVERDPLDTCLSNFIHLFLDAPQTCDLAALGRYYRAYAALIDHWRRALPEGRLVEVRYERLVADPAAEARRIVSACGLPWDEACLDFANNRRAVATFSAAAVREPVHRRAIGRALPYRPFLEPLVKALG